MRTCTRCGKFAPFHEHKCIGITRKYEPCKGCHNENAKNNYSGSKKWSEHMRLRYGISPKDYDLMVISQEGRCLICEGSIRRLHIDHCHATGVVRGLLCTKCNHTVGWYELLNNDSVLNSKIKEYLNE